MMIPICVIHKHITKKSILHVSVYVNDRMGMQRRPSRTLPRVRGAGTLDLFTPESAGGTISFSDFVCGWADPARTVRSFRRASAELTGASCSLRTRPGGICRTKSSAVMVHGRDLVRMHEFVKEDGIGEHKVHSCAVISAHENMHFLPLCPGEFARTGHPHPITFYILL